MVTVVSLSVLLMAYLLGILKLQMFHCWKGSLLLDSLKSSIQMYLL